MSHHRSRNFCRHYYTKIRFRKNLAKLKGSAVRIKSKKPKGKKTMKEKKTGSCHGGIWTRIPTSSSEKSAASNQWAMRSVRPFFFKINNLEVSFSAIHTVWTLWSCIYHEYSKIHLRKNSSNEYFKTISRYLRVFSLSGFTVGRSINGLVFFFPAHRTEVQVTVLSMLNLPQQGFPATCPVGYCCVCNPRLFASEIFCDLPTYNKQRMNKMSPSRCTCCLETQNARWRHVEWRL